MSTSHTPGPWIHNPGPETDNDDLKRANQLYVRLGSGSANAIVERKNVFAKVTDEDLANARLIAAAPELLATLKHCQQSFEWMPGKGGEYRKQCITMIEAAIAKATQP